MLYGWKDRQFLHSLVQEREWLQTHSKRNTEIMARLRILTTAAGTPHPHFSCAEIESSTSSTLRRIGTFLLTRFQWRTRNRAYYASVPSFSRPTVCVRWMIYEGHTSRQCFGGSRLESQHGDQQF